MSSKPTIAASAFSALARPSSSVRRSLHPGRLATPTQRTAATSPQHARLSHFSSASRESRRGGRPASSALRPSSLVRPRAATRSFGISTSLLREAEEQGKQAAGQGDVEFRQYKFEDISSALPSSSSSPSPSSTPTIIDVREPAELTATGIIPTALPLPIGSQPEALFLEDDEFLTRFGYPKPTTSPAPAAKEGGGSSGEGGSESRGGGNDLVFYCKAGVRARAAAQLAVQAGYDPRRIGVYDGSWLDWEKRGGRVEKWEPDE